ncbi:hypothetical protein [Enterobacter sp. P82]|uniref:hypothetical protein n=1 Tax=Enterobacter sp. P82 TaxID=3123033 RepID=UPI00300CD407
MKLPRYLKILLALTAILLVWIQVNDIQQPEPVVSIVSPARPVHDDQNSRDASITTLAFIDLFPWQGEKKAAHGTLSVGHLAANKSKAPSLPFSVAGTWWSRNQRSIILTDGQHNWIICHRCQAPDRVWIGDRLNLDWQLQEVSTGQLTFRWLPQQLDQRLTLSELEKKPTL